MVILFINMPGDGRYPDNEKFVIIQSDKYYLVSFII